VRGKKDRRQGVAHLLLLRITGGFISTAALLFLHAWWPIQAERNLDELKKIQSSVSVKKAELNELNRRIAVLTSLTALDHWAKAHGPWKTPGSEDIVVIEK